MPLNWRQSAWTSGRQPLVRAARTGYTAGFNLTDCGYAMMTPAVASLAVLHTDPDDLPVAAPLAARLRVPLLSAQTPAELESVAYVLLVDAEGVALQATGRKAPGPVRVDFTGGGANHRRKFGGGKGQMIAKAVGLKGSYRPTVLDATAGLGGDAFVLACLGCSMTLLERSPVVLSLLEDGLRRGREYAAAADPELLDILQAMQLLAADSHAYLQQLAAADSKPDVIYLDPMFPERSKSASVKKEMASFHQIVGHDPDADGLLALALAAATYRVVVKRPAKAPCLGQQAPSYQLQGKSCRYDVYTLKKLPGA